MFCPNCGSQVPDGGAFCGACGHKIVQPAGQRGSAQTAAPESDAVQRPRQEADVQQVRQENAQRQPQQETAYRQMQPGAGGQEMRRQQSTAQYGERRPGSEGAAAGAPPQKQGGSKKIIIAVVAIAAVIIIAAVLILFLRPGSSEQDAWQEQYDLGEQYLTEENYEQAVVAFTAAIEIDDQETDAYMGRAEAYTALGEEDDLDAALSDYDTVITLESTKTQAYIKAADIYVTYLSEYESAQEILEKGLEANPDDEELTETLEEVEELIEEESLTGVYQAFYDQLAALTETYGVFEEEQSGTMQAYDDQWFDPEGVLGAAVADLDADGALEMLVCIAEECEHYDGTGLYDNYGLFCHVMFYVYEEENGEAVEASSLLMGEYYVSNYSDTTVDEIMLWQAESYNEQIGAHLIETGGQYYIMCEYQSLASAFADGSIQGAWLLEYTGTQLQYVCSFSQAGGGSSDFSYIGYVFEDGECVSSEVYCTYDYYGDDLNPLYDDYGEALTAFFGTYGIQVRSDVSWLSLESIVSQENNGTVIFSFTNTMTSSDWGTSKFVFSANLERDTSLLDQ